MTRGWNQFYLQLPRTVMLPLPAQFFKSLYSRVQYSIHRNIGSDNLRKQKCFALDVVPVRTGGRINGGRRANLELRHHRHAWDFFLWLQYK